MKSALENVISVVLSAALSHLAYAAHAETSTSPASTWHMKPGACSWQSRDSYEESGVPSSAATRLRWLGSDISPSAR